MTRKPLWVGEEGRLKPKSPGEPWGALVWAPHGAISQREIPCGVDWHMGEPKGASREVGQEASVALR